MLSGTSPFKDASEWLIFQRIIAREIRFPDYFSDEARDLIDRLLVSKLLLDTNISSLVCFLIFTFPHFQQIFFFASHLHREVDL